MPYGIIKIDTVTFTDAGVDKSVSISGLVQNPTFSGNVTVTGTFSGVTVTGTTANFTSGNFTNISGGTHTITSGVFASGSAASPSITFTGDLNTGIYSPGADQVAISTGGSGRLFVDASGRVGVGTASPGYSLHVQGGAGASAYALFCGNNNGNGDGFIIGQDTGGLTRLFQNSATPITFWTNAQERLRITSAGLVGVGTSVPSYLLDLEGGSSAAVLQLNSNNATFGVSTNFKYNGSAIGSIGSAKGIDSTLALTDLGINGVANIDLCTNYTRRVRIDSSGRVGIGTTSPAALLHIAKSSPPSIRLDNTSTNYWEISNDSNLVFDRGGTERMRLDASGRLLVGTSSSRTIGGALAGTIQIESAGVYATSTVISNTNTSGGSYLALGKTRSNSTGGVTVVQANDDLGGVTFSGADGSAFIPAAFILGQVDGTPGVNDMPGRLVFSTTADGASSPTERLRITSAGLVGIGTSAPDSPLQVIGNTPAHFRRTSAGFCNVLMSASTAQWSTGVHSDGYYAITHEGVGERLRIDSAGRVGIGTTSPGYLLDIANPTSFTGLRLIRTNNNNSLMFTVNSSDTIINAAGSGTASLTLQTEGTERARIDSSGRLLLGTSSARSNVATISPGFQVEGLTNNSNRYAGFIYNAADVGGPEIHFAKSRGTAIGSNTVVADGDQIGTINFEGADGTNFIVGAQIRAFVDGTPGTNDMPGRLVFSTTADGASSPTERMRIGQSGIVDIGSGGIGGNFRAMVASGLAMQFSNANTATTNLTFIEFGRSATSPANYTAEGTIGTDGSGNLAFTNASDVNLKENIRDLNACLETVKSLRPVLFDWKTDYKPCCTDVKGFIAQEFEQVLPKSVSTDEAGIKSVSPVSELLPILVGAIKELTIQVAELEAKVAALESA